MPNRLALVSRVLLTVGLAFVLLTSGPLREGDATVRAVVVALTVVAVGSLLLTATERGRSVVGAPAAVSTVALVVLAACGVVLCGLLPGSSAPAVPLVASRLTAQARLPRWARSALLVVAAAALVVYNQVSGGPWWALLGWPLAVAVLFQSGLRVQSRRRQLEDAELLLAQEQALREEQVRSAAAAERTRIARDLHDVLAHTLSGLTVTLQATAALLEVEGASAAARAQVGRARALAVDGLAEARTAVASLAVAEDDARPDLAAVVGRQVREHRTTSGSEVVLELGPLPGSTDVAPDVVGAASGVLREALTNALRHAPGRPVRVALGGRDALVLEVEVDEGGPAAAPAPGGMGLDGMVHRAEEVGGTATAGPYARGWRVEATFPLATAGAGGQRRG